MASEIERLEVMLEDARKSARTQSVRPINTPSAEEGEI